MYDYVVWCAAFECTLSCLNLYWTRDNKLSYLILSYLITSPLSVNNKDGRLLRDKNDVILLISGLCFQKISFEIYQET